MFAGVAAYCSPARHQLTSLFEQITAPIGRLHLVGNGVTQRHFRDFARKVRPLGGPVAKAERNPCTVRLPLPMRRIVIAMAMLLIGCLLRPPVKMKSPARIARISSRIAIACGDKGTRCPRPAFMRSAGTVQSRSAMLISSQRAPIASPVRAAVKMANSRARPAIPFCCRSSVIKVPSSA